MVDDTSLVVAARAGSRAAVGELFDRHWPGVWRAAFMVTGRRDLADDVAQEAFIRAIQGLPTFDEGRPVRPWLRRITINCSVDLLRRERRSAGLEERGPDPLEDPELDVDLDLEMALRRLGWERRTVVVLHYWLGYRLSDIAEILEMPVGTVSSRLSRALGELRGHLEGSHG